MKTAKRIKRYSKNGENNFLSMKVNPSGASIGNLVDNLKRTGQSIERGVRKTQDTTSSILSAPARYKANKQIKASDSLLRDIKLERKTRGVDIGDANWKDPIFRARANVSNYKSDLDNKKKRY